MSCILNFKTQIYQPVRQADRYGQTSNLRPRLTAPMPRTNAGAPCTRGTSHWLCRFGKKGVLREFPLANPLKQLMLSCRRRFTDTWNATSQLLHCSGDGVCQYDCQCAQPGVHPSYGYRGMSRPGVEHALALFCSVTEGSSPNRARYAPANRPASPNPYCS